MAIMPTGSGKSLLFQLPALLGDGLTVVVSPLIALMRDQVAQMREYGIAAAALNSTADAAERAAIYEALERGRAAAALCRAGAAAARRHAGASAPAPHRPPRHRRGALRLAMGPRFPPRIYPPEGGGAGARPAQDHRRDRDRRRADPRATSRSGCSSRAPKVFVRSFDRPNLFLAMRPKADATRQLWDATAAPQGRKRHRLLRLAKPHRGAGERILRSAAAARCPITPASTSACAPPTRTRSCKRTASSSARPSPSAWASTSPTCASSCTPTCPPRSRAIIRRSAAPAATACPPTR